MENGKQRSGDTLRARQKAAILESLRAGAFVTRAIEAAGISPDTYYRWRRRDRAFNEACETALASRVSRVEDALYAKAASGNVTAMIFWLCNRAPDRWRHVQRIEQEVRGEVTHTGVDLDAEIKAVAERLRRELSADGGRQAGD